MFREVTSAATVLQRTADPPTLESLRSRIDHEITGGHCTDCDGFLEIQARSAAQALTPLQAGVAPPVRSPAEDRVSISPAARTASLRKAEDAPTRSRSRDEAERVRDAEAVGRAGPDPLDLDPARQARLERAVEGLAAVLDGAPDDETAEAEVVRYLQALDEETRQDLGAFVRTLGEGPPPGEPPPPEGEEGETGETPRPGAPRTPEDLDAAELRELQDLRARDREVRAHEQAHKATAGHIGGAIHYEFETGPDGKRYAVGGEVPVDLSPVRGDHRATVDKMQQVRRAALAPADPSAADRAVAARAGQVAQEAQQALRVERQEEAATRRAELRAAEDEKAEVTAEAEGKGEAPAAGDPGPASEAADGAGVRPPPTAPNPYASAIFAGASLNHAGGLNVVA